MPAASVVLSNFSFSWPDGRAVFSGLDVVFGAGRTGLIGVAGAGETTLLLDEPTNSLDLASAQQLAQALSCYQGAAHPTVRLGHDQAAARIGRDLVERRQAGLAVIWPLPARGERVIGQQGHDVRHFLAPRIPEDQHQPTLPSPVPRPSVSAAPPVTDIIPAGRAPRRSRAARSTRRCRR